MYKRIISATIAIILMTTAFVRPTAAAKTGLEVNESFYQELADLLSEYDGSSYFGEMELRVGDSSLAIDGAVQHLDAAPEIINNRTMLPIRAVAEAVGATVGWVQETATVVIESAYGDEISCTIGSDSISINSAESELDVSPYVKGGRTYLPLRAVSEALELEVDWDASASTITLTSPYQSARVIVLGENPDIEDLAPETAISDGHGLWVLQFSTPTDAKTAVEILSAKGIAAEPDYYIPPIEPESSSEQPTLSAASYSWGVTDCGFDSFVAANRSLFTSNGVVAVIDTGVDPTHPFLSGHLLSGYDVIDGDNFPNDEHGHGTHVSGIVVDCIRNAPVKILPVRVLSGNGSGTSLTVAAGIRYAVSHSADVINLSLGGVHSSAIDNAIEYAVTAGVTVVVAAGNDNDDTSAHCPAHITTPGTLVVSSGDSKHNKASSSNYGSNIDLMAPGVSVRAAIPNGAYGYKSGTSMATPHVAAAAMLLDLAWGKSLSPAVLEDKVHSATTNGSWSNKYVGYGFLNMRNAALPVKSYQVYFDCNGGISSTKSKEVVQGKTYGELPLPTRDGYQFDGWYTDLGGGEKIVPTTIVSLAGNQTLYAHWKDNSTTITFHSLSVPNELIVGSDGHVDGEIHTSNSPIVSVKAEIIDSASRRAVLSASTSGFSVSTYGPIKGSKIDSDLRLDTLGTGSYSIKYTASAQDGTTSSTETTAFKVIAPEISKTNIEFHSLTSPGNLIVGNGAHIDGSISSFGSPIVSVKAEVINASTESVALTANTGGFSLFTYGPIKNSKIDWDLAFGTLGIGTYYIKYTVNTQDGTAGTAKTEQFTIMSSTQPVYGWGAWSEWSTTPVNSTPSRQVETRRTKSGGYTEYRYGRYVDVTGTHDCWCATYLENLPYISGKAVLQYSDWSAKKYSSEKSYWTCGYCKGPHMHEHHSDDGRSFWSEYKLPSGSYYWEEVRTTSGSEIIEYRYRDWVIQQN